jgi:preprotein translocase subunit YajC
MDLLYPIFSLISQTEGPPSGGSPGMSQWTLFIMIGLVFYFMLIAPQRKRQKETEAMLSKIQRGNRVIFSGGIYGTVMSTREENTSDNPRAPKNHIITIEIDKNTRVEVRRESISNVISE